MLLGDRLRQDGYECTTAMDGRAALATLDERWPDVVLLDLMLPGMDGEEVARRIKHRADIPVIVLSAVSTTETKVEMLSRYAEDYITKPFQYAELEARMRRVLQRIGSRALGAELVLGPNLTLLLPRRRAIVGGRSVSISPIETRLLGLLAGRLGTTFTTDDVLASVWSSSDGADPAYVWVTIRRLRQKIEVDPDQPIHLVTVAGEGYRLIASEASGPTHA